MNAFSLIVVVIVSAHLRPRSPTCTENSIRIDALQSSFSTSSLLQLHGLILARQSSHPHSSTLNSLIMSSVTATDSAPHFRVSAAKGQAEKASDSQQQPSTRVAPPESIVEDQFFWTYTEEPHRSRRQAIIKAHPEVRPSSPVRVVIDRLFSSISIPSPSPIESSLTTL